MICPHCKYCYGYYWNEEGEHVEAKGEEGQFFTVSNGIGMERSGGDGYHTDKDKKELYGCPKCNKLFME